MVSSRKAVGAVIALAGLYLVADALVATGNKMDLGISPNSLGSNRVAPGLSQGEAIFAVAGVVLIVLGAHLIRKG